MPLQATSGAASYDAFGGGVAAVPNYIEDVFSTYLYTGNGGTQTITNSIDLSTKGGLVWIKQRNSTAISGGLPSQHLLFDTNRGANNMLASNSLYQSLPLNGYSFNNTGFTVAQYTNTDGTYPYEGNQSSVPYASWTFRKQPKFFDVVTYTGDGTSSKSIAHNLQSVPGCIMIKCTSNGSTAWIVWHNSFTSGQNLQLESTGGGPYANGYFSPLPTSSVFTLSSVDSGGFVDFTNASGRTYVAYLFAHNAGGFGLTGTDNVISCGSYTGTGATNEINLGYEAQWVMIKRTDTAGDGWIMVDAMRGGLSLTTYAYLQANQSAAEVAGGGASLVEAYAQGFRLTATGSSFNASGGTYIYIAIRRGPMKVPTSGTSVFSPLVVNNSAGTVNTTGFPVDLQIFKDNRAGTGDNKVVDRLRGVNTTTTETSQPALVTNSTAAEDSSALSRYWDNTGFQTATAVSNSNLAVWNWRRAPGFFDEVCWTGDNTTNRSISHNLQAAPELIIRKSRSASGSWSTLTKFETSTYIELNLNSSSEGSVRSYAANQYLSAKPTSTVFTVNPSYENDAGVTYVSYLFATCPGVSKVGFYTGTGTTQTINCGFTAGSRFVLIKRYDPDFSGDWYVWDSARGIVAGNDPYLLLNSTAAEVTSTDYIDTYSAGFEISSTAPAAINASGGTYIFLAIA